MSDIVSPRPVAGEAIASAWGQEVHDNIEGIQAGQTIQVSGSNVTAWDINVVFPRPYATVPNFLASYGPQGTTFYMAIVKSVAVDGAVVTVTRKDSAAVSGISGIINWIAIGTLAA
jgi:hypothetical protein